MIPLHFYFIHMRKVTHALDASADGYKRVMFWTVDTDIEVLSIAFVSTTYGQSLQEFRVHFSRGLNCKSWN